MGGPLGRWTELQGPALRRLLALPTATLVLALGLVLARTSTGQAVGGPVVVFGIAAENGGPGFQGDPQTVWAPLVQNIYDKRQNGGTGILVIGAGKLVLPIFTDQVTSFWNAVGSFLPGIPLTYITGAPAIAAQSLSGFGMVVVVSSESIAASGGLNQAEEAALEARSSEIATFVNGGGALFGLTQIGFANPFLYLGGIGGFVDNFLFTPYNDIEPTDPEGTSIGILHGPTPTTDPLDTCCWREDFTDWPSFMKVLANGIVTEGAITPGNPVALGGASVVIEPPPTTTTTTTTTTTLPSGSTSSTVTGSSTTSPASSTTRPSGSGTTTSTPGPTSSTSTTSAVSTTLRATTTTTAPTPTTAGPTATTSTTRPPPTTSIPAQAPAGRPLFTG